MSATKTCLTVEQMGAELGVSRPKAYELVHRDDFPKVILGRRIVIPREAFEVWLAAQIQAASTTN